MLCTLTCTLPSHTRQDGQTHEIKEGTRARSRFPFAQRLLLRQENPQHTLRAPWMTSRRRYNPEKKTPLSPLWSQLIQKLYSLHCDSCATELEQGEGALEVYGLPKSLLLNDLGRIESKPDLNDGWVDAFDERGETNEQIEEEQSHEETTVDDPHDKEDEVLGWISEASFPSRDRKCSIDIMNPGQPWAPNTTGVGCARAYPDSIAGPIGDMSTIRPDLATGPSSSELEQVASTPFFQPSNPEDPPPLLPPPTPRPRFMELSGAETDLDSDPPSPASPALLSLPSSFPHNILLPQDTSTAADWQIEMVQYSTPLYYSSSDESCKLSTPLLSDNIMSMQLEPPMKLPPFVHSIPLGREQDVDLEDTRLHTAYGRSEVYPSFEGLVSKHDVRVPVSDLPEAPRLDAFSHNFDEETEEEGLKIQGMYDPDAIYLYNPFDLQHFSSDSRRSHNDNGDDHYTQRSSVISLPTASEKRQAHSESYISSFTSTSSPANPAFPPGSPRPPKKSKSVSSSYALSEKSQWKLAVTQYHRSLSTRGMRHPGFPPSPLGPNWESYYGRV